MALSDEVRERVKDRLYTINTDLYLDGQQIAQATIASSFRGARVELLGVGNWPSNPRCRAPLWLALLVAAFYRLKR